MMYLIEFEDADGVGFSTDCDADEAGRVVGRIIHVGGIILSMEAAR